jgi:DNA-binding transcriptional MerR regulator
VRGVPIDVQKKLLLSVGSHRASRPLSPVEVAEALQLSLDAGSTLQEIAEFLHLESTSELTKFIRLLRLSRDVRHMVDWGRPKSAIGFTVASEVARLDSPDEQMQLCRAALEHQIGRAEMQQISQLHQRSGRAIGECVTEILQLRPRVQRIHVFLGAVTSADVRQRLAKLSQAERDTALRSAVQRAFPRLKDFGGKLGSEKFTITGNEEVSAKLTQGGIDFEAAVNGALAESVKP